MNKLLTLVLIIVVGGYSLAFVMIKARSSDNTTKKTCEYCEGWQRGIEDAMAEDPKIIIYSMPVCPASTLNQDNYNGGYRNGFKYILVQQLTEEHQLIEN